MLRDFMKNLLLGMTGRPIVRKKLKEKYSIKQLMHEGKTMLKLHLHEVPMQ